MDMGYGPEISRQVGEQYVRDAQAMRAIRRSEQAHSPAMHTGALRRLLVAVGAVFTRSARRGAE